LAEILVHNSCADRAFFCNSGAEANEGAIKLARKFFYDKGEDRYEIIACDNSFHGRTIATVAATGQEKYKKAYTPLLPSSIKNVPYRDINALKSAITPKTAAVLVECIQGEGGVVDGGEYLLQVRKLCDENGALMIVDEVQTGIGRTGTLFAYEQYGFEPDIFTLAKALGGGVPIGAVLAKEAFCAFAPGDHGTTFGGNPLACAAGLAVMREIAREPFLMSVREKGEYFKKALQKLQAEFPQKIADVRGRGLMLGIALAPETENSAVQRELLKQGFVIGVAGQNTLRFVPPLIIQKEQIDALTGVLANYFRKA
jgi:acetylornithine aminotransferase/acetylornithine/N-succinyldiaminopimelate aminotransferase